MSRDTSTGTNYEKRIDVFLTENKIQYRSQINIGAKRNGKRHRVDLIIDNTLVSLKHQQVGGTAEEKVPFEFMKLQHAVEDYNYDNAIIVLSGNTGWTWKEYYLSDEFKEAMKVLYPDVSIMTHENFVEIYS
jgi:hypothetical protein